MLEGQELYEGREQTWVKHYVLKKYLERFAHIIGSWCPSITYVDGFSGPWKNQSDTLSDTSFFIALAELRKARDTYAKRGKVVHIRCVFLEQDRARFKELKAFTDGIPDAEVLSKEAATRFHSYLSTRQDGPALACNRLRLC
jgi:three-Cys-motif partner protein